jgi:hypothetical protein
MMDGTLKTPGVFAPEMIATEDGILDAILAGLAERGVHYTAHMESQ